MMIAVKKAIEITLSEASILGAEKISILEAGGRILAEDVHSDIDMPPFDKSAMDGYALRHADAAAAPVNLRVVGFIPAGVYPEIHLEVGSAAKIMTGAPLPEGADAVQMVEKTEAHERGQVTILEAVSPGNHLARRGEVMKKGAKVVSKGGYISPAVAGVLATVGKTEVEVYRRPRVGILITGDELVPVGQMPKPGQIRNSNGSTLYNQVLDCGAVPELMGIASDDLMVLRKKIADGLKRDVLLISGGVSMGDLDLVEEAFVKLGVQILYDKIKIKPGKPTVFGRSGKTLVFGLPGNPVSASTVFEVIVKPALRKMLGTSQLHNTKLTAQLKKDFTSKTQRENYAPAWTCLQNDALTTVPIPSKGSADVLAFAKSNSFLIIPEEASELKVGQEVEVLLRNEFWYTSGWPLDGHP